MTPLFVTAVASLVAVGLVRLWMVVRERTHRRRETAWRRWWAAYRLRLPTILMARWSRDRALTYRTGPAS
ncbi:MAG: hypothetical protein ACRYFW_05260 [Janthinobacterium lividum]